jgi:transcriptional regulator with XRE-family HTH domain
MEKATFNKLFGEFVRNKRMMMELSQAQLGDKMALDYQYISRIERGLISPTLYWITRLAESLEYNPLDFSSELLSFIYKNEEHGEILK